MLIKKELQQVISLARGGTSCSMQIWNHTKLNKELIKIIIIVYKITKSNQKLLNNFQPNKENLKF